MGRCGECHNCIEHNAFKKATRANDKLSGKKKEKRIRNNADRNKCINKSGPKMRKMSELETLTCGGAGGRASKMESAHLAADCATSAKRVKTEVGSYRAIKIEDVEGKTVQVIDEKEMMELEEPAPPIKKKQDPNDPEYDEELDYAYDPPPESFIQSSVCAKSVGSEKHTSSRAKGLLNWSDGQIQLKGGHVPKSKVVVSEVLNSDLICNIDNIFINVNSKIDVASREMISHFKGKVITEKDVPIFEAIRNESYLSGRKKDMGVEYLGLICRREIPRHLIKGIRIAWQDPIIGEYNTPERAWYGWNGVSYTASVNDENGSRKVVEYCKKKYPTPLSVLTNDPSIAMNETKRIREALRNFSYGRRVKEIAAELFAGGGYAATGQQNLNAKVMIDAALKSVLTNNGEMVTDIVDVMSLANTGYKKASIMMHAWLGVDKAENIGVDKHMLENLAAIGLISDTARIAQGCKSDMRAQELESYLPRELWGHINDYFCSICQLLGRKDTEDEGIRLLAEVVEEASPEYKEEFRRWNETIIELCRNKREKKGKR